MLREHYKDVTKEEAFRLLSETTDGLVIIPSGEKDMIYGRKSTGIHYIKAERKYYGFITMLFGR